MDLDDWIDDGRVGLVQQSFGTAHRRNDTFGDKVDRLDDALGPKYPTHRVGVSEFASVLGQRGDDDEREVHDANLPGGLD